MFGKSSNVLKAMRDIQRIKSIGGTAEISLSQIVGLICNSKDAQRNLSPDEYMAFRATFELFRKLTECSTVDINGYLKMCEIIIGAFEKSFPYLLVDGVHSKAVELKNQIKIRKLYADGYKYKEALFIYEDEYDSIPIYHDYDPVKQPQAKQVFGIMENFVADFVAQFLYCKASEKDYGLLFGVVDALFLSIAGKNGNNCEITENAVTLYTMVSFGIKNYSDSQIDTIMKQRLEVCTQYYQAGQEDKGLHITWPIAKDIEGVYININPNINRFSIGTRLIDCYKRLTDVLFQQTTQ